MFQTTRRRLALWYTSVTAILLLLFASGFYLYVRHTLVERIDDTLNHVVEIVQRSIVLEPIAINLTTPAAQPLFQVNLEASFPRHADAVEDDHIDLEWFNPDGELLWSTFSAPLNIPLHPSNGETVYGRMKDEDRRLSQAAPQPNAQKQQARQEYNDNNNNSENSNENNSEKIAVNHLLRRKADVSDIPGSISLSSASDSSLSYSPPFALRQITHQVTIDSQVLGYLRVSHPWFEVTKPSRQLIRDLSLGTALMVGAVAMIGWFLSGLAIAPVRDSYQRLKQFTADASHELRNPIAVIQTNVQVALADPDPQLQQNQLKVIERLTRRLGRLVDDLLFLARQDSGITPLKLDVVRLDELIQEVVEEQQTIAIDKVLNLGIHYFETELTTGITTGIATGAENYHPASYVIQGDRDQLTRLFTNLISNAVQYTPSSGHIEITLQRSKSQGHSQIQVQIKDTGVGISAEALPHIFDRFYRVDPARTNSPVKEGTKAAQSTGSGLGLAIVKVIVENHQGQIEVHSQLHQGTTFVVTLPCYSREERSLKREA